MQQKALGGIMLLGLVALGADNLFIRGADEPATDATSEYAVSPVVSASPAAAQPIVAPNAAPRRSLAQRLRDSAGADLERGIADAFAPGAAWNLQAPSVPADSFAAEEFRRAHRLTGVLTTGGTSYAMIDGKMLAIGQTLDGFRLVGISHRAVEFESGKSRIVLTMSEGAGMSSAGAH